MQTKKSWRPKTGFSYRGRWGTAYQMAAATPNPIEMHTITTKQPPGLGNVRVHSGKLDLPSFHGAHR
ncbi:MAG: hypothetical protein WCJ35_14920, partial [Planctomycetota bacterium]